ncbi:hypothetical protein MMC07_006276 [Pseudocyphellaria aurata]|nr:hypothetical protein [Pseudocyphellaria aurata]
MDTSANRFVSLDEDEAYAGTSYAEWQLMVKQMENVKPLKIEDLEPDNRDCDICRQSFGHSDDREISEEPIQLLSCGHVFGHTCIFTWLASFMPGGSWSPWLPTDAYWPYESEEEFLVHDEEQFREAVAHATVEDASIAFQEDGQRRPDWRDYLNWSSDDGSDLLPVPGRPPLTRLRHGSCPKCRGVVEIQRHGALGVMIEARVRFWDRLYEKLGISRSAKEEHSRNDLLRYVQMVQMPPIVIKPEHMRSFTLHAQVSAMRFALRRGTRNLDSLQSYLRDAIFNLGCYGLHEDEYDPSSYEDRRVPLWCYQVDRIERGLSPVIVDSSWDNVCSYIDDQKGLLEYSRAFNRELEQLVSGPWRRTLFAEAGGDRDGLRWEIPWNILVEDR